MVHWFSGHTANQVRGITPWAAAVNNLVDVHDLKRLATRTAKAHQLLALVLKGVHKKKSRGALGAIHNAGSATAGYDASADTAQLEQIYNGAGAGIAYLNDEGDAKLISSNSPSPLVNEFITNLLLRDVCLAPGVPMEFFWAPDKLSGANQRFILAKADLFFQLIADGLIYRFVQRQVYRFLQWRIEHGLLAAPADPNWAHTMSFQMPSRITVDNGRDGKLEIEQVANGQDNLRGVFDRRGKSWRAETRQWIREFIDFDLLLLKEKATPEQAARIRAKWRAGMPGSPGSNTDPNAADPNATDPNADKQPSKDAVAPAALALQLSLQPGEAPKNLDVVRDRRGRITGIRQADTAAI